MQDESAWIARRSLVAAGALGAVAIAGLAGVAKSADYGDMTDAEKTNIKLVGDFCKAFSEPMPDPDKMFSYMTEDATWKQGQRPLMAGRAAVTDGFKRVLSGGARLDLKIIDTFARGSFVAHTRVDTRSVAGGPYIPSPGPIAGVFIIKGGKIAEWWELFFPRA